MEIKNLKNSPLKAGVPLYRELRKLGFERKMFAVEVGETVMTFVNFQRDETKVQFCHCSFDNDIDMHAFSSAGGFDASYIRIDLSQCRTTKNVLGELGILVHSGVGYIGLVTLGLKV